MKTRGEQRLRGRGGDDKRQGMSIVAFLYTHLNQIHTLFHFWACISYICSLYLWHVACKMLLSFVNSSTAWYLGWHIFAQCMQVRSSVLSDLMLLLLLQWDGSCVNAIASFKNTWSVYACPLVQLNRMVYQKDGFSSSKRLPLHMHSNDGIWLCCVHNETASLISSASYWSSKPKKSNHW